MEGDYTAKYYNLEKDHWWFAGRRKLILKLLEDVSRDSKVLDIGCSGGVLIQELANKGLKNLVGIDADQSAVLLARNRGLNVMLVDAIKTNFEDENFDMIIAADVLEHIENDNQALKEWDRILKKGGKIIILVPAFMFLWRKHDEENQHKRRYSKKQLLKKLKGAGFQIKKLSYWNLSSLIPLLIKKLLNFNSKDDLNKTSNLINLVLVKVMQFENFLATSFNIPIGVSLFVVAEKTN